MGELTPVRCGCGGIVSTDYIVVRTKDQCDDYEFDVDMPVYRVFCHQCGITTPLAYPSKQDAIRAWNIAMCGNKNPG